MIYYDGDVYEGEWKDGKWHGTGVYTHLSGERYEGEWFENEPHGFGVKTWPDGESYEGQWLKGKRHVRARIKMLTIAPTLATIKMANSTVKECTSGLMAESTEESFATVRKKAKASARGPVVVNTSASILMIRNTEKVVLNGRTVANILEGGRRAIHMEQEFTLTQRKKRLTVNGTKAR